MFNFKKGSFNLKKRAETLFNHPDNERKSMKWEKLKFDRENDGEKGKVAIGRDRQDKGEIIPYFEVYHVIIPKDKKDEILKNRK